MALIPRLPIKLASWLGLLGPWLAAQDPRRLCKRLELVGFENLVAADEAAGQTVEPLVLAIDTGGPWQTALWVVAYYRGGVAVKLASGHEPRKLAPLEKVGVSVAGGAAESRLAVLGESPEASLHVKCEMQGEKIRVVFTALEN